MRAAKSISSHSTPAIDRSSMKRSAGFLCSFSVVLIVVMSWFGCGGGSISSLSDPPPVTPVLTKIGVSPSAASIHVGQQQKYAAVGYDQFNKPMIGITFHWSSDNTAIAMIDNNGVAVGASQGSVAITATASGVRSAPASLSVLPPPPVLTTIAITPTASSIL
jgi:Bacterial Ig-like domain (group 2)